MSAEREVVVAWLHNQGFFTLENINAGNRVIDVIAIRQKGSANKITHVEVACSISTKIPAGKEKSDLQRRFDDSAVKRQIETSIKNFTGKDFEYDKILVTTFDSVSLQDVKIISFSDVIFEVMARMDKQNYRDSTTRTIQLIKYILLSNPSRLALLLMNDAKGRTMTFQSREELIRMMARTESGRKAFAKIEAEPILIELLRVSTLRKPERLAKSLQSLLPPRTWNKFFNEILKTKELKQVVKEELEKEQRSLAAYIPA